MRLKMSEIISMGRKTQIKKKSFSNIFSSVTEPVTGFFLNFGKLESKILETFGVPVK